MEVEHENTKGSKNTMKFLGCFSCFNCREIGIIPYILICNHIYCENCVSNFNMKKDDGSLVCPYCYEITKKSEILPELEVKLLISDIKSIDDDIFEKKYQAKLNFMTDDINCKNKFNIRDIALSLCKIVSLKYKQMINNNNKKEKKLTHKRNYLDFKKELKINEDIYEIKLKANPTLKFN